MCRESDQVACSTSADNIDGDISFADSIDFQFVEILFQQFQEFLILLRCGTVSRRVPFLLRRGEIHEAFKSLCFNARIFGVVCDATKELRRYFRQILPENNFKRLIVLAHKEQARDGLFQLCEQVFVVVCF